MRDLRPVKTISPAELHVCPVLHIVWLCQLEAVEATSSYSAASHCYTIIRVKKRGLLAQSLTFQKCPTVLPVRFPEKIKKMPAKNAILFTGMTEAEVIEGARLGDMDCFEALYHQQKRRVFSLCLRMTSNHAEAEDFMQETFMQLHRKIGTFRGESAFSTWLHRLSVNIILMAWRRKGLDEVSLEETLEAQSEDGPKKEIGRRDDVLYGSIDRIGLDRALQDLAPGYRMIFVLHDIEGYEHNEIATMLGCSIGNSKSQLHKARMKLRALLPRACDRNRQIPEFPGNRPMPVATQLAA